MFGLKRANHLGHEDLLRELASIEQKLLPEDSGVAMELMVLEAKIRERFQRMEARLNDKPLDPSELSSLSGELSLEEIQALIPRDLASLTTMEERRDRSKPNWRPVGMAAVLAVFTAVGVFGLASLLQIIINWLA